MVNNTEGSKTHDETCVPEEVDATISPEDQNNHLVNLITGMLDEIQHLSHEHCIYRVPQRIRMLNEVAYNPRVVSIGPFHYGDERFRSMESFKKRFLKKVIQRNSRVSLENYIVFLKRNEESIRQCYSETIEMGSDEFLTMMLVDGCFIIEFLMRNHYQDFSHDPEHSIVFKESLRADIDCDLILLENQIPFFVLEGLYDLALKDFEPILPFINLTLSYFQIYNVQNKTFFSKSIDHFTDLVLILHRPLSPRKVTEFRYTTSATKLMEAGVKFKVSSSNCLLDLKFSNGSLEIPRITLYDQTESLMRNIMALELCHYPDDSYMIDYFFFMDFLINTSKDVDLLVQGGIIENWLGDSEQAAHIYNNVNKFSSIRSETFYFSSLCKELNEFCKVPRHEWNAILKRDYFSSPWRIASTSAAIVLLVLTFIQTVCSILGAA